MEWKVELSPPTMAARHVPIPLTGLGTVELRDDGIAVTAGKVANGYLSHIILASILFFGLGSGILIDLLGAKQTIALGLTQIVVLVLVGKAMRRGGAKAGAMTTVFFPWKNVRDVVSDPHTGCFVILIEKMKPKGGLYVAAATGPLEEEIRRRLQAGARRS